MKNGERKQLTDERDNSELLPNLLKYRFVVLSRACGFVVFAIGLTVMVGWTFDIPILKSMLPGMVAMKVNTALGFILSGLALWLKSETIPPRPGFSLSSSAPRKSRLFVANFCGATVALLGLVTLCEYLLGGDWMIDECLFHETPDAILTMHPGRMAPNTALSFVLLGAALLSLEKETRRAWRPAQVLAAGGGMIALLALTDYIYGSSTFYFGVARYTAMALHTTLAFVALSIGVILARPNKGWAALFAGATAAGHFARRVLPVAVGAPLLLGWLSRQGEQAGLFNNDFGDALSAVSNVIILAGVIWWTARSVEREETRRRRMEEAIGRISRQQALILDSAQEGILGLDSNGRHTFVNVAAARMLGYESSELIGRHSHTLWHHTRADGRPYPGEECPIYAALRDGTVQRVSDEVFWRKDGASFPVEYVSNPIVENDRASGAVVVFHDITERKRVEAQLHQQQKLAATGTLARGMAHEINNPINGIMNYAQLIKDDAGGNAELAEFAGAIIEESRRVARMTHTLLTFTQHAETQASAPVALSDLVASVLPPIEEDARKRGITLSLNVPPDLPAVSCRQGQIGQVMAALLANALEAFDGKSTKPGINKRIAIGVERIERGTPLKEGGRNESVLPASDSPASCLRLTVEDNGSGIPPAIRERVFDPFFTTKDRTQHSGLGLWISRSVVHDHGGELTVESVAGKGTKVHVDLPCA